MSHEGNLTKPIRRAIVICAAASAIPIGWLISSTIDRAALTRVWQSMLERPLAVLVALAAFGAAFMLRAIAWRRILPDLPLGHALAALHVSLGGNHVLPLRMGEPLRIVSVVRRARISWDRATASTVTLRAGDIVAIAAIGAVVGSDRVGNRAMVWLIAAGAAVTAAAGIGWLTWIRRGGQQVTLPGPMVIAATMGAWILESVVLWQAGTWAGLPITPGEAVMASAAAVMAQLAAIAPAGIGTYEAGGTAALVVVGHDPATALAVVVTAHAVKTAYSLVAGAVGVVAPSPGLLGRLRLPRPSLTPDRDRSVSPEAPVVLFMPAHDEAATVGEVVARVPAEVEGRKVVCLVIDDGSTDETAHHARRAGATVVSLEQNHGLGAAVRRGLHESLRLAPAAVAFCDADGEYAPEELSRLVEPILAGKADYVVGSRFRGEIARMLPHRRIGNRLLSLLLSWVARRPISDGQSGYRAFSPEAAATAEIIHDFNYAQVLTLDLLAKGLLYREVPISYRFRTTGRSFVRLMPYLRAVIPAVYREVNTA